MADDLASVRIALGILRAAGVSFDDAWRATFPPTRPHRDRCAVRLALAETEAAWRRSYERLPAERAEVAASILFSALAERDPEPSGEIVGVRCG